MTGFVGNDGQGVLLEVEGPVEAVEAFLASLTDRPPPAAIIQRVETHSRQPEGSADFQILGSRPDPVPEVLISPDLDCCSQCLAEILDPEDRRYQYPFTNCTNCGPRYTVIERLPYDRQGTTMAGFAMCPACRSEYDDPGDRRFHAQPNACPSCGPALATPLEEAAEALCRGEIVAVKGVGGYHLACLAEDAAVVSRLRRRKGRMGKPLAVMVDGLVTAEKLAWVTTADADLLSSRARPIVVMPSRGVLPAEVAPGTGTVGLMLPYSPLHHLLMRQTGQRALIMTSANPSGQPICISRAEAEQSLAGVADRFLHHDRPIKVACDDSVITVFRGQTMPWRRSRGYAPFPVSLPFPVPDSLAVGGQLKSTFCLGRGRHAFLSQHLGDLESVESFRHFQDALAHLRRLYGLEPRFVCCDSHPDYLSSRWAAESGLPVVKVQHHHAHIAAIMVEQSLPSQARVLGLAFDGTGFGSDHTVWGGELLEAGYGDFRRLAWLEPVPLPGGDRAIREPWRMALSHLWAAQLEWSPELPPVAHAGADNLPVLRRQLERSLGTVPTSSVGRLFDAVASVLGLRQVVDYEAQAAIELEAIADRGEAEAYEFGEPFRAGPMWRQLLADLRRGVGRGTIAMRFHRGLAGVAVRLCCQHRAGDLPVALSGGVFQNLLLLELVIQGLEREGLRALFPKIVPANDGGLALGQLAVGAYRKETESSACAWASRDG